MRACNLPAHFFLTSPGAYFYLVLHATLFTDVSFITFAYRRLCRRAVVPLRLPSRRRHSCPLPNRFRTQTTFVDNVLSVDVRYHEGPHPHTRYRQASASLMGALPPPGPCNPGHTSREMAAHGKTTTTAGFCSTPSSIGMTTNPADYLAAGWWLRLSVRRTPLRPSNTPRAGVFVDGPETRPPPDRPNLPLTGHGHLHRRRWRPSTRTTTGRDWGKELVGSSEMTEFAGVIAFTRRLRQQAHHRLPRVSRGRSRTSPGRHLYPILSWRRSRSRIVAVRLRPVLFPHPSNAKGRIRGYRDQRHAFRTQYHDLRRDVARPVLEHTGRRRPPPPRSRIERCFISPKMMARVGRFTGIFDALTPANDHAHPMTAMWTIRN